MHDNVIQLASAAPRPPRSTSALETTAVIQFSPRSIKTGRFPKMASLKGGVSTDISLNEDLREKRRRKFRAASAKVYFLRALIDMHTATHLAQDYGLAEAQTYPPAVPADYNRFLAEWRKAVIDQLLTPAPDRASLSWKRSKVERLSEYDWVGISPARVERAIADDEAFLNAHPTRHCRHRPK